ncbi:MAG: UDP-N-acetylmuramate dehydrogenase [Puniceicoccales bacterium]|jgi:UDP-N-acetylenolpyruvoylglucosamine reductase|nr:UDP-N-acetylmuramate dehydrogenase [Puniceicoccales bacterium]
MNKKVCMLGICGAGMAPLAIYLSQRGYAVYGWDDHADMAIKDLLVANKIVFLPGKILPPSCDCVIRSSAIDERNDEICKKALEGDVAIFRRGEFLAKACSDRKLLAVLGSHGKTSVSGNCVEILKKNGVIFDYVIGGFFKKNALLPAGYDERSEWIVVEIDESDGTMENFSPECTIALNYDDDHVGNYGSRDNFLRAFRDMFDRTKAAIFVPELDATFANMAAQFADKYIPVTDLVGQDFQAINKAIALFCLNKIFAANFTIPDRVVGIQRRNDIMLRTDRFTFLNDYAHHPTEIAALLRYVKAHYSDYDLNVVFQPHRLSRTKQYFAEFAEILDMFDRQFVVELYAAFEERIEGVSSTLVFDSMKSTNRQLLPLDGFNDSMKNICKELAKKNKKQLVMFVGAGNILENSKKFLRDFSFEETEKNLTLAKITFTSFADLTNSFSIRVKTAARIYVEPETTDKLIAVLSMCQNFAVECIAMGNGTKILPPDGTINAVVLKMTTDHWKRMKWIDDGTLYCSCGTQMKDFCREVAAKNYVGVEKLTHIPCCLGGAICMNAGAHGQTISDKLLFVEMVDRSGNIRTVAREKLNFVYRGASIPSGNIVLGAIFKFKEQANADFLRESAEELLLWRRTNQPKGLNFGSVFKNGDDFCAGELIDKAGLKGRRVGGAKISEEHANFIINSGNSSAKDIEKLIDMARYEVNIKFGKFLQTEIRFIRAKRIDVFG